MQVSDNTLAKLSFERVRAALAERAGTFMGVELANALAPLHDEAVAERALERVQEVVDGGFLALGGIEDVRGLVRRVRDGNLLDGTDILSIAYTLDGAATLRRAILHSERPALAELALEIGTFDGVLRLVREQLDPDGNVRDDATPKLYDIRRRLNPLRGRIRDRLTRLLEQYSEYVQDPIITLRRERYVIPIKANHQARVPGLALDRSDSGATVFIEPAGVVDLNNELALLEMEERDEVRRILLALGRRLADEPLLDASLEVVAKLDVVNASARLASDWRLTRPAFDPAGRVRLAGARHPLVTDCVPNDILLDDGTRLLVITGPNAGGKTVLIKTVGLAALMAYSGLFVAADGARQPLLPYTRELLCDIGDEQSIEASLSTYAGHLRNLRAIVDSADEHALVLIDELGSGTDPDEGAAISQAILEAVVASGARGLVTTHLAPLKVFASETPGVTNAAMRFDVEALRPAYQLVMGQPGRSYALAIADRLGLGKELLARAAELLGPEGGRLEGLLLALEEQREELEEQLAEARVARETAGREAEQLRDQIAMLRGREGEVMAAAAARAEALLKDTLQHAARLKRSAREEPELRSKALEEIGALRRQARKLAGRDAPRPGAAAQGDPVAARDPLSVGMRVRVASYDAEGPVLERRGDQVVVQLGLIKVEVPVRDVDPVKATVKAGAKPAARRSPVALGQSSTPRELNLRGERVEAGLELLRDFIMEAHALKAESVRVLHGKGTGALRDAVRSYLKGEKLVERFEDAVPYEGGHGVTVAYLRY
ncbi:MAG: Smr/MutS family protein [Trueperaceae bacterium]|nr:Smr/MutS family protein [Trueperaceae bacterium]